MQESVEWSCSEGHRWTTHLYRVRQGRWCPACASRANAEAQRNNNLGAAKLLALERGGECLETENFGMLSVVRWRCGEGHEWDAKLTDVDHKGTWCPHCGWKIESVCGDVLRELLPGYTFKKTRAIPWLKLGVDGAPLELDLYCPELGLAVEYNGRQHYEYVPFFHKTQDNFEHRRELDRLKAEACENNWVTLIVIPFHKTLPALRRIEDRTDAIRRLLREKLEELGVLT